ncbi:MAG: class I SAM-dependent methyltransferase [Candidatus Goldbacteria bacterium]|nr:class I SAM-dependent methyltransferase [Candidatus Goldiibacteriota bacterium]
MNKCYICSSEKLILLEDIVLCKNCFFYKSLKDYKISNIAFHYDSYTEEKHRLISSSHYNIYDFIIEEVKKYFGLERKGFKALEVGFGHGEILKRLKGIGFDVFGIDLSVSAFNYAIKNGLKEKELLVGDFLKVDFKNTFDIIILNEVLEEFLNPCEAVQKIDYLTKNRSLIVIRTKNSFFHIIGEKFLSWLIRSFGVITPCGFSLKSIEILLKKYSFRIKKISFKLTKGDPYNQFKFSYLTLFKEIFPFFSNFMYLVGFRKYLISPSFIVIAVKEK